ncbi:MAG: hypothetical protein U1E81_08745 [Xanthobacteraceae bacterium]
MIDADKKKQNHEQCAHCRILDCSSAQCGSISGGGKHADRCEARQLQILLQSLGRGSQDYIARAARQSDGRPGAPLCSPGSGCGHCSIVFWAMDDSATGRNGLQTIN